MFHGKSGVLLRLVRAWKSFNAKVRTGWAGELIQILKNQWLSTLTHINIKCIQSSQFRTDSANWNVCVLQINFAMSYSCEYQDQVQSATWSRESVIFFNAEMTYKSQSQIYLIVSDKRDKGKDIVVVFIDFLHENCCVHKCEEYIIWSEGPTSEFKNNFMVIFLQILIILNNIHFHGNTSHQIITKRTEEEDKQNLLSAKKLWARVMIELLRSLQKILLMPLCNY